MFEWAGNNLSTVFAQRKRVLDPHMWALIYDVLRFNACAPDILLHAEAGPQGMSIGEYLEKHKYSASFRDDYLIVSTFPP